MGNLLPDLRYAIRQIRKSPGFAVTVITTLALGIGANTAVFSVMNAVLLRSLPVHEPDRLVYLSHAGLPGSLASSGNYNYSFGINAYHRLREDQSAFSDVVAYVPLALNKTAVRYGDTPEEITADEVSGNFFAALGVPMAIGQPFAAEDEDKHSQLAVISYGYWTRRFNRDPGVLGKPIFVNGIPLTITGVAAPRFDGVEFGGGTNTDLWVPLQNSASLNAWGIPATAQNTLYSSPNWYNLMLMARLKPELTPDRAIAEATPLFAHAVYETVGAEDKKKPIKIELFATPARGLGTAAQDYQQPLRVLMGMVAVVLLIACVNIVMLLAARNTVREREFALRLALGANRWPLFRQLLAESTIIVAAGSLLGWLFALQATRLLAVWSQIEVSLAPDKPVLLFTLGISAFCALLFGLAPLRAATRAQIGLVLKSSGIQTTPTRERMFTGKLLISMQMAFCVVLLFASGSGSMQCSSAGSSASSSCC